MRNYQPGDTVEVFQQTGETSLKFGHHKIGNIGIVKGTSTDKEVIVYMTREKQDGSVGFGVSASDIRPKYWKVRLDSDIYTPKSDRFKTFFKSKDNHNWSVTAYDLYYGFNGKYDAGTSLKQCKVDMIELTLEEWESFNYDGLSSKVTDIIPNTSNSPEWDVTKLKVGDLAVITQDTAWHGFVTGSVVTINSDLKVEKSDGRQWYNCQFNNKTKGVFVEDLANPNQINKQTNNMEQVKLTRGQLVSLLNELGTTCGDCKQIIQYYLDKVKYHSDDCVSVIEQQHLDRIKELNDKQKVILSKYITLPERKTLQSIMDEFGKFYTSPKYYSIVEGNYIKVPLPFANSEWTFNAYRWVERFCKKYPECYPIHGDKSHPLSLDPLFLVINCQSIKQ